MAATGISEWMPVIQTLSGAFIAGSVAIGVSWLNHHFARAREERAAAERQRHEQTVANDKKATELLFIASELVFLLEQFAQACANVATDQGYQNQERVTVPEVATPKLDYSVVSGDWRVLPVTLMYKLRELSVIQSGSDRTIAAVDCFAPDFDEFFAERQYQYTRLGLKALILAIRLRKLAQFPATRLDATTWSAQPVLWKSWRLERNRRAVASRLQMQALTQLNVAFQQRISDNLSGGEQG